MRVFQKILGLTANVMDRFGHLTVCVRTPPGCCACVCVRACPLGVRPIWVCVGVGTLAPTYGHGHTYLVQPLLDVA